MDKQIILNKDAQGNVTVLTQVPEGCVDAQGNDIDPVYRSASIKSTQIDQQVIDTQAKLQVLQSQQQAVSALPVAPQPNNP